MVLNSKIQIKTFTKTQFLHLTWTDCDIIFIWEQNFSICSTGRSLTWFLLTNLSKETNQFLVCCGELATSHQKYFTLEVDQSTVNFNSFCLQTWKKENWNNGFNNNLLNIKYTFPWEETIYFTAEWCFLNEMLLSNLSGSFNFGM